MFNLLSQWKTRLIPVTIALITPSTLLVNTAEAFVSDEINNSNNQCCNSISAGNKLDLNLTNSQNLTKLEATTNNQTLSSTSQQQLLEDSRNLIKKIKNPQIKTEMLINLAWQYYELNEVEVTKQTLNEALEVSQKVKQNSAKTLLMIKIATTFIEIQELETASEILDKALENAEKIADNSIKASLLMDLASKYRKIGDLETAENILAKVNIIVAEIENPPPSFPFQPLPLQGELLLGTNLFFAKDSRANFDIGINLSKRWYTDEINLYFKFLNSYDTSRNSGEENRILFDLVTQYKHYLQKKFYLFGNLGYLQDDFSNTDSRLSYFTGFGLNVWEGSTKNETFDMQLGIGDLFQDSTIKNENVPFPVLQYALIYKNLFFTNWKFQQIFALEFSVRNAANYFTDSRSVITIPAINNWSVFGSLNLRYFGIPEVDEPNLSTGFTAGLKYDF